jgi:hypothetical protein
MRSYGGAVVPPHQQRLQRRPGRIRRDDHPHRPDISITAITSGGRPSEAGDFLMRAANSDGGAGKAPNTDG